MKIIVYFENESPAYGEVVATFASDELYNACLPMLKAEAKKMNMIVTESVREDEELTDAEEEEQAIDDASWRP
jgi:hypothetical protein